MNVLKSIQAFFAANPALPFFFREKLSQDARGEDAVVPMSVLAMGLADINGDPVQAPTIPARDPFMLGAVWNDAGLTKKSLATASIEKRFEINDSFGVLSAPIGVYKDTAATIPATTVGDVVKCLKDEVSGATLTQATTGTAPTLQAFNGRWVLRFTLNQYLSNSSTSISAANLDIWLVARISSASIAGPALVTAAAAGEDAFNSAKSFRFDADEFSNVMIVRGPWTAMRCAHAKNRAGTLTVELDGQQVGTGATSSEPMTGVSTRLYLNALAKSDGTVWAGSGANMDVEALYISHSVSSAAAGFVSKYLSRDPEAERVVFDGDSLTDSSFSTVAVSVGEEYPSIYQQWNPSQLVINRAFWGDTIANVTFRQAEVGAMARNGAVYVLLIGRNDLSTGSSAATILASITAHCQAIRAYGFARIYVGTQIPEAIDGAGTRPAWESVRVALNASLRSGYRAFCNGIIDFAADPRLQDPTNLTYFMADRLHQSAGGCLVKAELADIAINRGNGNGEPLFASRLKLLGIPTASTGLVSGDVYSNAGVLTVVP